MILNLFSENDGKLGYDRGAAARQSPRPPIIRAAAAAAGNVIQ